MPVTLTTVAYSGTAPDMALSSDLGIYSGKLAIPTDAFVGGLGDHAIVTALCPGGKERMRQLMEMVRHGRLDLTPLLTHRYQLDNIEEAYDAFGHQRDGVLKRSPSHRSQGRARRFGISSEAMITLQK